MEKKVVGEYEECGDGMIIDLSNALNQLNKKLSEEYVMTRKQVIKISAILIDKDIADGSLSVFLMPVSSDFDGNSTEHGFMFKCAERSAPFIKIGDGSVL